MSQTLNKTKVNISQAKVTLFDLGYPIYALWFTFKFIGFPVL